MWQLQRWWWFCECYQCVAGLGLCACRVGWMHGVYLLTPSCWRAEAVLPSASPLGTPVPPARVTERPSGGSCATCVSRSTPEVPGAAAIRGVIDLPVIVWCESGLTGERRWRRRREALSQGAAGVRRPTELRGGAVVAGSAPAQAALTVAEHEDHGRIQYYKLTTPSVGRLPRVNVLLPDGYDTSRRYPVLFLLHDGGENYSTFDTKYDIRNHTAGRSLIVVMPDGGAAGWYCDPESSNVGPRNWETFHIKEFIPRVDATFATTGQPSGRAISGFSMGGFGALKYAAKHPELFGSVSSHSGPADLRIQDGAVVHWANFTAGATDLKGAPSTGFRGTRRG